MSVEGFVRGRRGDAVGPGARVARVLRARSRRQQLKSFHLAKWQKVIDVNLTGTLLGTQAAVEPMTAASGDSIINVSSIEGLRGAVMSLPRCRWDVGPAGRREWPQAAESVRFVWRSTGLIWGSG
jgi:NAD(P)-dependent dehydrogenase (short-subunit alcohol dehydrogenase family)